MAVYAFLLLLVWASTMGGVRGGSSNCDFVKVSDSDVRGSLIKTDGFPRENYKSDTDHCWIIENVSGGIIVIEFRDFHTEPCCDRVVLYDRDGLNDVMVKELYGNIEYYWEETVYISKWNRFRVNFRTDASNNRKGWQACICPGANVDCVCAWDVLDDYGDDGGGNDDDDDEDDESRHIRPGYTSATTGIIVGIVMFIVMFTSCGLVIGMMRRNRRSRNNPHMTPAIASAGAPMHPITTSAPVGLTSHHVQEDAGRPQSSTTQAQVIYQPSPVGETSWRVPYPHDVTQHGSGPEAEPIDPPPYSEALAYPKAPSRG